MEVEHLCNMTCRFIPASHRLFTLTNGVMIGMVALSFVFGTGCQRTTWDNNPAHGLRFSSDTVYFDTVFTTVGSVTLPLKVYNDHEGTLLIDDIELDGGLISPFRINVNGLPATDLSAPLRDTPLAPGDSMFVFVEVTVDPNESAEDVPFWVREDLIFRTNGIEQNVKLLAKGQNAVFHGGPDDYTVLACDEVWDAQLPHVLYGRILVEAGCTLTIMPGTKVHAHTGSGIWIRGGTLLAEGELGAPITMQGDRLDDGYVDTPGQWGLAFDITDADTLNGNLVNYSVFRGGLWLDRASECRLDHVQLSQATVGIWVDSVATGAAYALSLTNSSVTLAESIGLLSQGGHIIGYNNLLANCGQACGYFALGGDVQMHLSTFANYASYGSGLRQFPTLYVNDWYEAGDGSLQLRPFTSDSEFRNCIAVGNNAGLNEFSEVIVDLWIPEEYLNPLFVSSSIHHQDETFPVNLLDKGTTVNLDPPFVDELNADFRLSGSAPTWTGTSSIPPFDPFQVSTDLLGEPRNTFAPTKGCYERVP